MLHPFSFLAKDFSHTKSETKQSWESGKKILKFAEIFISKCFYGHEYSAGS